MFQVTTLKNRSGGDCLSLPAEHRKLFLNTCWNMTKMNKKQPKAVTKSKFQISVEGTNEISTAYHKGIQAIKNCDRSKIIAEALSDIDGSVDIDNAVKHIYPNDNRWDYAIGYKNKATNKLADRH